MNSPIIVNNENCSAQIANVDTEYDVPFTILEKLTHKINGYGYACVKTKLVLTLTYHWYLASDRLYEEHSESVSRDDCMAMVISKKCDKYEMKCKDAYCHGEHKPKGFFKYGQTLFFEGYRCTVQKIMILGQDMESTLFNHADSLCLPKQLWCQIGEVTIIWDEQIIHSCPFHEVRQLKLNVSENIYTSDDQRLLFQKTRISKHCNVTMVETTEGVYLAPGNFSVKLTKSDRELKSIRYIIY